LAPEGKHILWKHRTNLDYVNSLGGRNAGEVIGLAQTWDQVGKNKPDPRMPVQGLYLVGCDAGGRGVGTEQAADSALKVSDMIGC
jgi:prolycopene isomerase